VDMQLRRISLARFKAFTQAEIEVAPLTVLLGPNNAGKSTVLQAITLLAQSAAHGAPNPSGPLIDLGNDAGALAHTDASVSRGKGWEVGIMWEVDVPNGSSVGVSGPAQLEFRIEQGVIGPLGFRTETRYSFKAPLGRTVTVTTTYPDGQGALVEAPHFRDARNQLPALSERAQYGSWGAFASEPQVPNTAIDGIALAKGDPATTVAYALRLSGPLLNVSQHLRSISYVGPDRHVQSSVYEEGSSLPSNPRTAQEILDVLNYRDDILDRVSTRLQEIFEVGLRIRRIPPRQMSLLAVVGKQTRNVVNLGSGFIQLAWIATRLELAKEQVREAAALPLPVICIEEPELHLHPGKQPEIARLLSNFVKDGTQVICTSQSEHFLMALLQMVLDKSIRPEDLAVHYVENGTAHRLLVDETGRLSGGMKGFFEADETVLLTRLKRLMERG
jgi:energy-coupling factor transporter ATP-binding protein EcfA2